MADGFRGEACEFGAENEGCGLGDVELCDEGVVFVGECGDNAVDFGAQVVIGLQYGGVFVVVNPFVGAH